MLKRTVTLLLIMVLLSSCDNAENTSETYNEYQNNIKGYINNSFVCYNEEQIFYIGDEDNYIYVKDRKSGESTLLLDKCVSYLQCVNNELYFLMDGNGVSPNNLKGFKVKGKIYKYNYKNNELICLYDNNVNKFWLSEEGIRFRNDGFITEGDMTYLNPAYYILSENGKTVQIDDNEKFTVTYNGKYLQSLYNADNKTYDIFFYDPKNETKETIIKESVSNSIYGYISNNTYYDFDYKQYFHKTNLFTKEHTVYDMTLYDVLEYDPFRMIIDFTVINDEIYFAYQFGNNIYRIDKAGELTLFHTLEEWGTFQKSSICNINSSGDELYVYTYSDSVNTSLKLDIISV